MSDNDATPAMPAGAAVDPRSSRKTSAAQAPPAPRALFPMNEWSMAQREIHDLMASWVDQILRGEPLYLSLLELLHSTLLFDDTCKEEPALSLALRNLLLNRGVAVRKGWGLPLYKRWLICTRILDIGPSTRRFFLPTTSLPKSGLPRIDRLRDARAAAAAVRPSQSMVCRMSSKYKDDSSKLSSAIGQSWNDYVNASLRFLDDCDISQKDGAKFIHNVLNLDDLRFYTAQCRTTESLQDKISKIEAEFNSRAQQNQVKIELAALHPPVLVAKKSCTVQEAIEFIRSEILSKIQLFPVRTAPSLIRESACVRPS